MEKRCIICGNPTNQPFSSAVDHFRPFQWEHPDILRGNIKAFGFWDGMNANIMILFPFINTIRNWKYRKLKLVIPE